MLYDNLSDYGECERILEGCFENYLRLQNRDPCLDKVCDPHYILFTLSSSLHVVITTSRHNTLHYTHRRLNACIGSSLRMIFRAACLAMLVPRSEGISQAHLWSCNATAAATQIPSSTFRRPSISAAKSCSQTGTVSDGVVYKILAIDHLSFIIYYVLCVMCYK